MRLLIASRRGGPYVEIHDAVYLGEHTDEISGERFIEQYDLRVLLKQVPEAVWAAAKQEVAYRILSDYGINDRTYGNRRASVADRTADLTTPNGRNSVRENQELANEEQLRVTYDEHGAEYEPGTIEAVPPPPPQPERPARRGPNYTSSPRRNVQTTYSDALSRAIASQTGISSTSLQNLVYGDAIPVWRTGYDTTPVVVSLGTPDPIREESTPSD